jgi:predicted porin
MKKQLLFATLAMLTAGTAIAQSSVTMYGRLNVTLEREKFDGETQKNINNNASRLGFKGVEDLGGGLKAGFNLEHRFNIDTGAQTNTAFWGGAGVSEVNLGGGFGMIRLGHFTSEAYYATADWVSMHNHDTGTSADAFYTYLGRDSNKASYRTPDFGGFTLEGGVGARDEVGDVNRTFDLAANYAVGPLALGAGYQKDGDQKQFAFRAAYTLGAFVFGGYAQRSIDILDTNGFNQGKRNAFRLSGMYTLGASEFHLNVGRAGEFSNVDDSKATQYTVAYNYNLSKRTKVYTYYTKISDNAIVYGKGADYSSIAVGMRHNF